MARLVAWWSKLRSSKGNHAWLPLLVLTLFWALLGGWCHLDLYHCIKIAKPWPLLALGSSGYLVTVVGFVIFGSRNRPADISSRIAVALAVGAALVFVSYTWNTWPDTYATPGGLSKGATASLANPDLIQVANTTKAEGNDPLSPVNALAAVLALVLAVVTLIAQKSAVDARVEAERAREDILQALDIRALALSSRLLERAQSAKTRADLLVEEANEISNQDEDMAYFLRLGANSLTRLARFFSDLHRWMLEPRLSPAKDLVGIATTLILDLHVFDIAKKAYGPGVPILKQSLRTEYWQPAVHLIESLLDGGLPSAATSLEVEKVTGKLHEVRAMLNQL